LIFWLHNKTKLRKMERTHKKIENHMI